MIRIIKIFVLILGLGVNTFLKAQKLYWIGGSGNFNDQKHWSLLPNGNPANILPNDRSNVIFKNFEPGLELKIEFSNHVEVNSISIQTNIKISFVKATSSAALLIRKSFEVGPPKKHFVSNVPMEFNNKNTEEKNCYINSGAAFLDADVRITSGHWRIYKLHLNKDYGLYINNTGVDFYFSHLDVGNLSLSNCKSLNFDHANIKIRKEARVENAGDYKISKSIFGKSYVKEEISEPAGINDIAGKFNTAIVESDETFMEDPTTNEDGCTSCVDDIILSFRSSITPAQKQASYILEQVGYSPTPQASGKGHPCDTIIYGISTDLDTIYNVCGCKGVSLFLWSADGAFIDEVTTEVSGQSLYLISEKVYNPCFSVCNATSNIVFSTGSPPTSFTIIPPGGPPTYTTVTSDSLFLSLPGLCAGTLDITATDSKSCTLIYSQTIPAATLGYTNVAFTIQNSQTEYCAGDPVTFNFSAVSNTPGIYNPLYINMGECQTYNLCSSVCTGTKTIIYTYNMPGVYNVVVTDSLCPDNLSLTVNIVNCNDTPNDQGLPQCMSSFKPSPGDYILSFWVKEASSSLASVNTFSSGIKVNINGPVSSVINVYANGASNASNRIIDGWQKVEQKITIPASATDVSISLINNAPSGVDVYFDDIRFHPFNASFKSYVYDPVSLRLSAELDERNYATFYEYDEEGQLIRVKKETERGIQTIKESRTSVAK